MMEARRRNFAFWYVHMRCAHCMCSRWMTEAFAELIMRLPQANMETRECVERRRSSLCEAEFVKVTLNSVDMLRTVKNYT